MKSDDRNKKMKIKTLLSEIYKLTYFKNKTFYVLKSIIRKRSFLKYNVIIRKKLKVHCRNGLDFQNALPC